MKFICFGYLDAQTWARKPPGEQNAMVDSCFAYDETLKKNGNWVQGEALEGATTLSYQNGKVAVTAGPYAETKELLGGLLILEAKDLKHAIQLISDHPGMKMGRWEIRPAGNLDGMIEESRKRRAAKK
ncbi:MAG: YciI family protein [Planctomycetes bacterium]|nr:YciI family protein [Planctomycetota bacterium]